MEKLHPLMVEHGYDRTTYDHYVFIKRFHDGNFTILQLYMDDMLIVGYNTEKMKSLKEIQVSLLQLKT